MVWVRCAVLELDSSTVYLIVEVEAHVLRQIDEMRLVTAELVRNRVDAQLVQALGGKQP